AERVRDAAFGCDWVGTPLTFLRCLSFVIKMANKEFVLTAGKFVPVSNATMMNAFILYVFLAIEEAVWKSRALKHMHSRERCVFFHRNSDSRPTMQSGSGNMLFVLSAATLVPVSKTTKMNGIATVQWICFLYGMPAFYGLLVCIACSQLEKLRANLLDIRQELDTPAQDSRTETDTGEGRQVQTSQEVFCRMQEQLNDCIRHHQLIIKFRRAGLVRILRLTDAFIWEDLPHIDPETGSLAMAAWIPRVQKISFFLTSVASLFHVTQSSIRLLTSEDRPMIYGTWYPFDITKSPTYELMNIAQGIASVQWICFLYGLPAFYGTLVSIACSQLEKLRANLLDIRQKLDSGAETAQGEGRQVQPSQEVFCGMQEQLTECIRHHQLIIEYIRAIEEMFNPFLAGYFLNLMCGLCFTAYTAVTRLGDLLQLSQTIVIYSFYAINVFVFCWFGSELSDQESIPNSILAMFLSIYHDIEDLNEVVDAAMFFIISSAASCTQLYFRFRRATLVRTLRLTDAFIWEDLPHTDPDTGSRAMTAWIPRIQRFTTLIIGAAVIVNGTKNLMLIFSSDNHSMVYHTWYPFDTAKSPTYELINIAQVIATIQWACFFYGVPSTYATLVCIACSQLEKLRANLLNIRQVFDTPAQESRAETGRNEGRQVQTSQEVFCRMQEQLNDCIRHHQLIIQ
ncbi:hypothetical protein B7P43_G09263, partial [Cryptotermes secundus]